MGAAVRARFDAIGVITIYCQWTCHYNSFLRMIYIYVGQTTLISQMGRSYYLTASLHKCRRFINSIFTCSSWPPECLSSRKTALTRQQFRAKQQPCYSMDIDKHWAVCAPSAWCSKGNNDLGVAASFYLPHRYNLVYLNPPQTQTFQSSETWSGFFILT